MRSNCDEETMQLQVKHQGWPVNLSLAATYQKEIFERAVYLLLITPLLCFCTSDGVDY